MVLSRYAIAGVVFFVLVILETHFPLFKGWSNRWRHIGKNFGIAILNNLVFLILLSFVTANIFQIVGQYHLGLSYYFALPKAFRIGLIIILFDLWMYIWHMLVHRSSFLWRFHRMHHSDTNMDVSTALRFHPGEIVFSGILRWGIFLILGMTASDLLIYETIMLPVIFLHHSNFYLPEKADRVLRQIVITPWMHEVHHSRIFEETNSNYGTIFSWWDRLFGSFRLRNDPQTIHYGLPKMAAHHWQTFRGMLKTPFLNTFEN